MKPLNFISDHHEAIIRLIMFEEVDWKSSKMDTLEWIDQREIGQEIDCISILIGTLMVN